MNKKIVLYGGSFSPPHIGHASVVESLMRLFPSDEIWIIPSADRHDKIITASGNDRIKMWQIMIDEFFNTSVPSVKIKDYELTRGRPTETYETMTELKHKFPDYEFYFVLGSELIPDIKNWKNGEKLFSETNFIAINNPLTAQPSDLPPSLAILNEDLFWSNISSTFVRKLISQGHSGLPYITKGVAEYIKNNNLYR